MNLRPRPAAESFDRALEIMDSMVAGRADTPVEDLAWAWEVIRASAMMAPPANGERCWRCHADAPNLEGCAACNPIRLGQRLRDALATADRLRARVSALEANSKGWGP